MTASTNRVDRPDDLTDAPVRQARSGRYGPQGSAGGYSGNQRRAETILRTGAI